MACLAAARGIKMSPRKPGTGASGITKPYPSRCMFKRPAANSLEPLVAMKWPERTSTSAPLSASRSSASSRTSRGTPFEPSSLTSCLNVARACGKRAMCCTRVASVKGWLTLSSMLHPMSKQAFDQKLAALEELRSAENPAPALRKALKDRNNYYVSKAASIVAQRQLADLKPDLFAAIDRFFTDAAKTDPQCWAKNALIKALKDLGHHGPAVYLRGIEHIQLEPVWGGQADSAGTLRGACALALVECSLDELEILRYLCDRLADTV